MNIALSPKKNLEANPRDTTTTTADDKITAANTHSLGPNISKYLGQKTNSPL
jgi:hypothetical protein